MDYKEMTREQKDLRQEEWKKILDTYCTSYIKPCDRGCPCDRCHYDWDLQLKYVKRLHELGEPLLDEEIEKYGEYL